MPREADVLYLVAQMAEEGEPATTESIGGRLGISKDGARKLLGDLNRRHRLGRAYVLTTLGRDDLGRAMTR